MTGYHDGPQPGDRGPGAQRFGPGDAFGHGHNGAGDPARPRPHQLSPEEIARRKAAKAEAERLRKKRERFATHRDKVAARREQVTPDQELDDFEMGQVNKSVTSMRKYRDQRGAAQWDLREVGDRPDYGLRRIRAIRQALADDEETHNAYLSALRSQLQSESRDLSVLDATDPKATGRKFEGNLHEGFRLISASV